jgi:hypothetical protein
MFMNASNDINADAPAETICPRETSPSPATKPQFRHFASHNLRPSMTIITRANPV